MESDNNNNLFKNNGHGDPSKKHVEDFTFGKVLGEGAYGAVVLGKENETGREFAIKMLEKKHLIKENKVKYATTERDILTKCGNHPNIVKLFYTFKDENHLYYVMELCPNGELLAKLNKVRFDEASAAFYAAEIVNALEYLHTNGIIHRDLKPENILLDEGMHVKVTDFGTAKVVGSERNARSNSFVGTAEYVSPELLNDKVTYKSSDLWALGCIIYQMIAGRPPFRGISEFLVFQKVSTRDFTYPKGFPETAKDLINKLLVVDPEQRLGAHGYQELKAHPFFNGINWESLHLQIPSINPLTAKLVFEEDVLAEEDAKRKKMQEEESEKWKKFLQGDEVILESGLVWKRKGRSVKKRQLILTNKTRIIYIDTKKMVQKGEIPWSANLRPEAKNNISWFIHTPKRTYILEDIPGNAHRWVEAINKQLEMTGMKK